MKAGKLLFISFIVVQLVLGAFLLFDNSALAQGTYSCVVDETNFSDCNPEFANCELGYVQGDCSQWDGEPSQCTSTHTCEPITCELDADCPDGTSCRGEDKNGNDITYNGNKTCYDPHMECDNDSSECTPSQDGRGPYQYSCKTYDYDGDGEILKDEQYCRQVPCDNDGGSLCADDYVCWEDEDVCKVSEPGECDESNPCPNYYECNLETQQCELTVDDLADPLTSGTYSCEWVQYTTSPTTVEEACVIKDNSCATGYLMEPECSTITDETECNNIENNACTAEEQVETGTSRCVWSTGGRTCYTKNDCAPGYEPTVNCERFTVERYGEESAKALCDQNNEVRACVAEPLAGVGDSCDGHEDCKDRLYCDPNTFECKRSEFGTPCDNDRNCQPNMTCEGGICMIEDCREGGLIPCGGLSCPCTFCHFFEVIHNVVEFLLFTLGPILASLMIVVGGFFVLTSRGNQSQYNKGKNYIKWALLGYLLMLGAWLIINTILTMLDLADWVSIGDWWKPNC